MKINGLFQKHRPKRMLKNFFASKEYKITNLAQAAQERRQSLN